MSQTRPFKSLVDRITELFAASFEKVDNRLMIFVLLCLNFLSFTLSDNEEAYLPLAKQFMDPGWIPNSFTFTEWPGNRLVFQWITGWCFKYLSFEQFVFWARLLVFLAIAFPIGSLFRRFRINNLSGIILLQIYLIRQNYFAGEFIFGDYEAKSLAYVFVCIGLNCMLVRKYPVAAFYAVLASYLHILVGGWFFILVLLYTFFYEKSVVTIIKQILLFTLLIAPFAFYLGKVIINDGSFVHGVNIDWIYVYFRNPHHTAPFALHEHWIRTAVQVAYTATLFLLTLFVFRKSKDPILDKLYILNVIVLSILFISLGISFIDKQGSFLKFYPFRIAALGMFLMYLYIYKWVTWKWNFSGILKLIFILFGFYLITAASIKTFNDISHPASKPGYKELIDYVTENTGHDDVILSMEDYDLSFSRKTRREVFVIYKFDPGGGSKIYEWYYRNGLRKELVRDIKQIDTVLKNYRLDYVLSNHSLPEYKRLKIVFQNKDYYLYKIL